MPKKTAEEKKEFKVWWANHGRTFSKARDGGFLWAPAPSKNGSGFPYWESLTRVNEGDVILNYAGNGIVSIGKARGPATSSSEQTKNRKTRGKKGWRVDLEFYDLEKPIHLDELKPHIEIINSGIRENKPFNEAGAVNNGYLFDFSKDGLKKILAITGDRFPEMILSYLDTVLEQDFITFLRREGLVYDENKVKQFITALHTGAPVLLAGPPGTGKTQLLLKYAGYVAQKKRAAARVEDDISLLKKRWYKLSYNDKDVINAFQGYERKIDQVRHTMLSDGLIPVGWDNRELNQKKIIKELMIGDVIVAYEGAYTIGGIGIVTHQHFFDETGDAFDTFCESAKNFIRVEWIFSGPLKIKDFTFKEYNIPGFGMWKEAIYLMSGDQVEQFDNYLRSKNIRLNSKEEFIPPETSLMVPVQADWHNGETLLGGFDRRNSRFYPEKTLTHILNAQRTQSAGIDLPFFLFFDEMNLAPIDHYFADFLSALESGEPVSLHDSDSIEQQDGIPKDLRMPENLFIAGTLNHGSETTRLSPKVLDRFWIIKLEPEPAESFLKKSCLRYFGRELPLPSSNEMKHLMAPVMLEMLAPVRCDADRNDLLADRIAEETGLFQAVSDRFDIEISQRAITHILRYMYTSWALEGRPDYWKEWTEAFDSALRLKILPVLRGRKESLDKALKLLYACCFPGRSQEETEDLKKGNTVDSIPDSNREKPCYKTTAEYLEVMMKRLENTDETDFFK